MLTRGAMICFQNNVRLSERVRDCVPALTEYILAWDARIPELYDGMPTATGGRALIVALAPNAQHRVWMSNLETGDVSPEEAAFVSQVEAELEAPGGIRAPIMFAVTYWLNTAERFLLPNEVKVPSALMALADVHNDGGGRTYDEILELIWPESQ
jgi:hypothetical protein